MNVSWDEWTERDGMLFRHAARVILLDDADRVLLIRGHDYGKPDRSWWFTPGGGILPGENAADAARRELQEETGIAVDDLVGPVAERDEIFEFYLQTCRQHEFIFSARTSVTSLDVAAHTAAERELLDELKWWPLSGLRAAVKSGATVYPAELPEIAASLLPGWDGTLVKLGLADSR